MSQKLSVLIVDIGKPAGDEVRDVVLRQQRNSGADGLLQSAGAGLLA